MKLIIFPLMFVLMISIASATTNISLIDTFEFETSSASTPVTIKVEDTSQGAIYATFFEGLQSDGYVKTYEILNNGSIVQSIIDTFEFDTTQGLTPSALKISNNTYFIVYRGPAGDGFGQSLEILNNGTITGTIESLEVEDTDMMNPNLFWINQQRNLLGVTSSQFTTDGIIGIGFILDNGSINRTDRFVYNDTQANRADSTNVSNNIILIAYHADIGGNNFGGAMETLYVLDNGSINHTIDYHIISPAQADNPSITRMSDNVFAITYEGTGTFGLIETFNISDEGIITDNSIFTYEPSDMAFSDTLKIANNTLAIIYSDITGVNSVGEIMIINITDSGNISNIIQNLTYDPIDPSSTTTQKIMHFKDDFYIITYEGEGGATNDGFITIINISGEITPPIPPILNDTTPPVLTLINPANNTVNNTFPINITFIVTDDSSNVTCILTNNTYIFDERTFLTGTNYLTLQVGNESELSQAFPNLNLNCYDNTAPFNNSATMLLNYTIDKVLPLMFIILPELNATFNKIFTSSTPIYTTCFDDNVYRLNVTIWNSSDIIFSEEDMNPVGNTLEINSVLDISELGIGTYQKSDFCSDSHTAKNIPNYDTIKVATKRIRWTTPIGNEFELECSYSEGILDYGTYKSSEDDRYIFYYFINDTDDGSSFDVECELENRKFPVDYIQDSPIPAPHFIMGLNWMDFILENDADAEYEVSINENNNYIIDISTNSTNLTFSSVGELNTIEIISQIEIVFQPPREDEYILGTCPVDTVPRAMMFIFFIMMAFVIVILGFTMKNGLIASIGSFMVIGTGVYLWFCLGFISLMMMLLGVVLLSISVFKGAKAFR